jgi:hypothetical protein
MEGVPIDVDLHQIPANPAKGEGAHWHADFRYVFLVNRPALVLQREEVSGHAWLEAGRLGSVRLGGRVARLAG